jgi:uncharacterized protein (DUF3084 family)
MTFWSILALLVLVSGLVAYAGDRVAKWAGKKHWRAFGLRPRATATLVAMMTGVVIGLGAFAAFFLSVRQARETILEGEQVRQERNQLRQEKTRFTGEIERLSVQIGTLKGQAARAFGERDELVRERDELAAGQKNTLDLLRETEIQLQITKNEEAELTQEAAALKAANQNTQAALGQAEEQAKAAKAKLQAATLQLQLVVQQSRVVRQKAQADQGQLKAAQQALKAARQELKAAQGGLKTARLEVADLLETRKELIRERVELDAARTKLERQAQEAGQRLQSLEAARKAAQKQVTQLEAKAQQLEAEKRELEGDVTALQIAKGAPKPAEAANQTKETAVPVAAVPTPKTTVASKSVSSVGKGIKAVGVLVKPNPEAASAAELSKLEVAPTNPALEVMNPMASPNANPMASPNANPVLPTSASVKALPQPGVAPSTPSATPSAQASSVEVKPLPETALEAAKTPTARMAVARPAPDQAELIKALKASEAALKANETALKTAEANLKAEGSELKRQLAQVRRENQQLRENRQLLLAGLERVLRPVLLAEQWVEPSAQAEALSEVVRRAELKTRLWGLKGAEVVQAPPGGIERPGLLLARPVGVSAEGRVQVGIEFRPREQAFTSGEVLLVGGLILPSSPAEIRRRVALWERDAQDKLAQAGWIPEKLLQGGITLEEIVLLSNQIAGKRGGAKVGVVALDDLFTTEPPRLGLKVMP